MNIETRKTIIGVTGILVILIATYVTKNANCLWGLILVVAMLEVK